MEVFVARQPIFDQNQNVFGYELLYRTGPENYYQSNDGDQATKEVIANSFLVIGLESLTNGKRAFINFTEKLLEDNLPAILPPDKVAVEILEKVQPREEIVSACRKLKGAHYKIVLDDFIFKPHDEALVQMADIIKIDFLNTTADERRGIIRKLGHSGASLLAEKVETLDVFNQAVEMGFSYFQGYFFSKPVIMSSRDVPVYKLNYLQVLQEINRPDMDFGRLENIIKNDVSLSYKLLRFINSAAFGFRTKIKSIKHALVILGSVEIKKWVSLIALRGLADDKPEEILMASLARAKMGELVAPGVGLRGCEADLFFLGLFSMLDALVGRPMPVILADIPISENVKNALIGRPGRYKDILELLIAYEKGQWDKFSTLAQKIGLNEKMMPRAYLQAIETANTLLKQN